MGIKSRKRIHLGIKKIIPETEVYKKMDLKEAAAMILMGLLVSVGELYFIQDSILQTHRLPCLIQHCNSTLCSDWEHL